MRYIGQILVLFWQGAICGARQSWLRWVSLGIGLARQSRTASPVGSRPGAVRASRRWRGNAVKGGKVVKLRQGNAVKSSHVSAGPVVDGGALARQSG